MATTVGFALLTHSQPPQVERLVRRLNEMYGFPPIVCHHDFGQCALDRRRFAGNVSFVVPHQVTSWGTWSVADSSAIAVHQLFDRPNPPDWFVLLSGTDYPIRSAEAVVTDLKSATCDAFVQHALVDPRSASTAWERRCARRYFAKRIWFPGGLSQPSHRAKAIVLGPGTVIDGWLPFSEDFRCYYGSHFLTANSRCAERIAAFRRNDRAFARHCRNCPFPEEIYFPTILRNTPGLTLNGENCHYIDWSQGGAHPKTLTEVDLPAMMASRKHFARKFSADSSVLRQIDLAVDRSNSDLRICRSEYA